jgi:hypothetical protein
MVRLSLWFVDLALEVRRSLRILVKSSVRNVLLGVDVRIGKKVFSKLKRYQYIILASSSISPTLWNQLCPFSSTAQDCPLSSLEAQAPGQRGEASRYR